MGIAAARGNKQALDALLNYKQHGWLLSSVVFSLQAPAHKNLPEAVNFLIKIIEDDGLRPLWHGAAQGLKKAVYEGNERAQRAVDKYKAHK